MGPGGRGGLFGRSGGDEVPACLPGEVSVTVRWERDEGGLRGQVIVENTGGRACRLPGKPRVRPLGMDGAPLPVRNIITMEWRNPGHVVVEPGQRAAAPLLWAGWDGAGASPRAEVEWGGGTAVAPVEGPVQPTSAGPARNLTSSWFDLLE
jgi:hypothetical protein